MGASQGTMVAPEIKHAVDQLIKTNKIMIFSKSTCPYCKMAKDVFNNMNEKFTVRELNTEKDGAAMQDYLGEITGARTVPRVFINGECIGGGTETQSLSKDGTLKALLTEN